MKPDYERKKVKIKASLYVFNDYLESMKRLGIYQSDARLKEIVDILEEHIQSYFPKEDVEDIYVILETIAPQGGE